ncbi:MAG: DNA polymerase IV, partial [Candidatus Aenigmarchaeota archaeon]|nr:DNA polymerase IV [Candidatus Aenigmarchaeota archaeon]
YLPVDFQAYRAASESIARIGKRYAEKFEQVSIDEMFLDLTHAGDMDKAKLLAEKLKQEVFEKDGLTCSIGIGPNKLVAKIATDMKKPNGLTVITPDKLRELVWPLRVRKLLGVGKKTEQALKELSIHTIGDLARFNINSLIEEFGTSGFALHRMANGLDDSDVEDAGDAKSISRENTFEKDTDDPDVLGITLLELARDIHKEMQESGMSYRTVSVKVRYEDFETHTRARTIHITNSFELLYGTAKELMQPFLQSRKKVRLVGIKAANLIYNYDQTRLTEFAP